MPLVPSTLRLTKATLEVGREEVEIVRIAKARARD
jgi:hypothetical protein